MKKALLVIFAALIIASSVIPTTFFPLNTDQIALASSYRKPLQQQTTTSTLYLPIIQVPPPGITVTAGDWPMVAANPERTSWSAEEVTGNLHLEWYRPIEAYIPQNFQIIAANNLIYVSTANGLYAFRASTGDLAWRFDTEMPLGNSPTVAGDVLYVAGYDRKLHAINAISGAHLWSFDDAQAGYDTNPLVVDGKVILGNRDGTMYAIGAHYTANQGRLIWKYSTGGPIHISPAYKDGVIYFAAADQYAYALSVVNGSLIWRSQKLPGDGFHTYWPVIYRDKVIFAGTHGYRVGLDPGSMTFGEGQYHYVERNDLFPTEPYGTPIGSSASAQPWSSGFPMINASRIAQYLENNPNPHPTRHKPWRRVLFVLNRSNGTEFTFDSDGDGYQEYAPVTYWGTQSGNIQPPLVAPNGILYVNNFYMKFYISQGRVMGWNIDTPTIFSHIPAGQGALDEPQALSGGGNTIYRNISGDNASTYFSVTNPQMGGALWSYNSPPPLSTQAPNYDEMLWSSSTEWNFNVYGNQNGIYGQGGIQSIVVPYQGKLYTHRGNSIIAYGRGTTRGKLATIWINNGSAAGQAPTVDELRSRLESEVQKIIQAGHLRPGYLNSGQFNVFSEFTDYFENPGDTLYTLSIAYPYLSPSLQAQTRTYLRNEFMAYFDPMMYAGTGWSTGSSREATILPPDIQGSLASMGPRLRAGSRFAWDYPQINFYAMWKYAVIVPEDALRVYDLAKSKLQVPVPSYADTEYFRDKPWEHNGWIGGYIGFLKLQETAGMVSADSQLRQTVTNELNRLQQLRITLFDKNTPWAHTFINRKHLNIARNYMMLVPEFGDYLHDNMYSRSQEAINEYQYIAPYWFVSRFEFVHDEGVISNLYNYSTIFRAKAFIMQEPYTELVKYLDAPAFERGDLFSIQNLVTAIQAGSGHPY